MALLAFQYKLTLYHWEAGLTHELALGHILLYFAHMPYFLYPLHNPKTRLFAALQEQTHVPAFNQGYLDVSTTRLVVDVVPDSDFWRRLDFYFRVFGDLELLSSSCRK